MHYTLGVLFWLSHPAALNLASAQLSKHNATAGTQHLHILIKLQIWPDKKQNATNVFLMLCFPRIQLLHFVNLSFLCHHVG